MPSHYETESQTTLKEEYEAMNAKAFKKINRLTMISYFIAYSFFDQNIELSKKCMDLINQLDYKACIFPLEVLNDDIDEAKVDYFLMSVIGHNVEMILHSEARRKKRVNDLQSRLISSVPILCRKWIRQTFSIL